MRTTLTTILSASVLAAPAPAGECPTLTLQGEPVDLSTGLTTQRLAPAVAFNAVDGEYLVVWFDLRNPGNNDVFGQRVSDAVELIGGNIAIMEFAAAQVDPAVAHNPIDNEYLVAWRTQQSGFFNKTRGRRLAADGALIGGDFFVGEGFEMDLLHNPDTNEYLHTGRGSGIRGQRISSAGTLEGAAILIATSGAPAPNGEVARDPLNARSLATWRDQSNENLQGRLVADDGTLASGPILISAEFAESGRAAAVAHDAANGRFLVVFGVFQENRILGQFVDDEGAPAGPSFTIADGLVSRPAPTMAFSPATGAYVVTFSDGGQVHAIVVTADGTVCDTVTLDSDTFGIPAIVHNPVRDDFFLAWVDDRNFGEGEQDIFAQVLTFAGCPEDLNGSGAVDFGDIVAILAVWGSEGGPEDLDGSGVVDFGDLLRVLRAWGPCP